MLLKSISDVVADDLKDDNKIEDAWATWKSFVAL